MRPVWLIAGIAMAAAHALAQSNRTLADFWPETDFIWKTSTNTRFTATLSSSRDHDILKYDRAASAYLDIDVPRFRPVLFKRISDYDDSRMKRITLEIGYRYDHSFHQTPVTFEERPWTDAAFRWVFPWNILASERNRFEFRLVNKGYSWRYRNRFRLEKDWRAGKVTLTPYASAEAYHDSRTDEWNQFRFQGGAVMPIGLHFALDLYHAHQIQIHAETRNINAAGVTLDIYLRR
jgi:hypothetical protein